ncbi:MAG TPA: NAD(P)(+) transhydrogenase (Re/Si-specific) subunit beta, partial [Micromonosporaceae bacterium]
AHDFLHLAGTDLPGRVTVATAVDVAIGAVTFAGSLVAAGKLQGIVSSAPVVFRGARALNTVLAVVIVGAAALVVAQVRPLPALAVLTVAALVFGVTMVLPIGGADMPVVISLLNAFTGTAVAMAGFVVGSSVLIIAGALVGASGAILTKLMADAMNRSLVSVMVGGFGTGDVAVAEGGTAGATRTLTADDAAIQLAYASRVVMVPGYGLAAAQAQHQLRELADLLGARGVAVSYGVHPVAGRMPGHMNVLLAEADVSYADLLDLDEANQELARADVALVIGANDVVNPAARRPGNPVSGMPILDVDRARNVIVIKRSMGHGYAGIDNELYHDPKTGMYFADARRGLTELAAAVKVLVG